VLLSSEQLGWTEESERGGGGERRRRNSRTESLDWYVTAFFKDTPCIDFIEEESKTADTMPKGSMI
jgi:hypothetical protein